MVSIYDNFGLRFAYPENWTLTEEPGDGTEVNLSVSSPNTAFWMLAKYAYETDTHPLIDQAVQALRREYPDLEVTPTEDLAAGIPLAGCDANFICLDLTSTVRIRACCHEGDTILMIGQAEDQELLEVDPLFRAMTESLLQA